MKEFNNQDFISKLSEVPMIMQAFIRDLGSEPEFVLKKTAEVDFVNDATGQITKAIVADGKSGKENVSVFLQADSEVGEEIPGIELGSRLLDLRRRTEGVVPDRCVMICVTNSGELPFGGCNVDIKIKTDDKELKLKAVVINMRG